MNCAHSDVDVNFLQVRNVMERQVEMERALMQQHETLRHENGMLWQQIEISRRNQDALNSKLSQVISTFQHIANRFSTSRPSKIVAPNGQQLIEYQDHALDTDQEISTPLKRARCVVPSMSQSFSTCYTSNLFLVCRTTFSDPLVHPLCVVREDHESAGASSAATVLGQISQILRDGLIDASGC